MPGERRALRVGLVGCGRIAQVHSGYLRRVPQALLVGACDASADAREAFARRWEVPTYAEFDEFLAAAQPDAVHVLTPPATHASLVRRFLAAGTHVLVEKPMAVTVAEADAMVEAARAAGRVLTVDHNRWFDPVVEDARRLLASGALGTLVGVDVSQGIGAEAAAGDTPWQSALPGGPLFDSLPHPAYLIRGFVGPIDEVRVAASATGAGQLSEVRAMIRGEHAFGTLTMSARAQPVANRFSLYGTLMTAEVNLNHMTLVVRRTRQVPKIVGKVLPNLDEAAQLVRATVVNGMRFLRGRQRYYPGMGVHLQRLYAALAAGEAPPVSAEEGRDVVALAETIWDQAGVQMSAESCAAETA
jgi:predicted dehydrogenase